jgi:hypothetical protein
VDRRFSSAESRPRILGSVLLGATMHQGGRQVGKATFSSAERTAAATTEQLLLDFAPKPRRSSSLRLDFPSQASQKQGCRRHWDGLLHTGTLCFWRVLGIRPRPRPLPHSGGSCSRQPCQQHRRRALPSASLATPTSWASRLLHRAPQHWHLGVRPRLHSSRLRIGCFLWCPPFAVSSKRWHSLTLGSRLFLQCCCQRFHHTLLFLHQAVQANGPRPRLTCSATTVLCLPIEV